MPPHKKATLRSLSRRSHRKSRLGCSVCKSRKVKCDENLPKCGQCSRLGRQCGYEMISADERDKIKAAQNLQKVIDGCIINRPTEIDGPDFISACTAGKVTPTKNIHIKSKDSWLKNVAPPPYPPPNWSHQQLHEAFTERPIEAPLTPDTTPAQSLVTFEGQSSTLAWGTLNISTDWKPLF